MLFTGRENGVVVTSFTGREKLCSEKGLSVSRSHVVSEQAQTVSQALSRMADSFSVLISLVCPFSRW